MDRMNEIYDVMKVRLSVELGGERRDEVESPEAPLVGVVKKDCRCELQMNNRSLCKTLFFFPPQTFISELSIYYASRWVPTCLQLRVSCGS